MAPGNPVWLNRGTNRRASHMRIRQHGFTMVEMMVVVGIIGILALLMLPSFTDKIIRDQINEALPLADIAKPSVALAWATGLPLPTDNAAAGLPTADKVVNNYISAVRVQGGAIHVTFGNRANGLIKGRVLTLRPAVVEDAPIVPVTWVCGYAAVPDKMTAKGANQTNIPATYLPFKCRAA